MKITELFGKQIYSIFEGEDIGTIISASFSDSLNKIKSFKIFDLYDNEYCLPFKNIKAINSYVLITNKNKLLPNFDLPSKNPFFKIVIDSKATSLGKIIDAEIDTYGNIIHFITEKNEILEAKRMIVRKDFVYYPKEKVKLANYRPKSKVLETESIRVNILDDKQTKKIIPTKLSFNPAQILGKTVKTDLFGKNNEIIIKTNQQISQKTIDEATRHNCLNQLFYISI